MNKDGTGSEIRMVMVNVAHCVFTVVTNLTNPHHFTVVDRLVATYINVTGMT
jgi:hypothetical protein